MHSPPAARSRRTRRGFAHRTPYRDRLHIPRHIDRRTRMREMIGAAGKGTRHDDGGFDAPTREFARIDHRHRIHGGFGSKIRRQIWRGTACRAAARYPDQQSLSLLAQLRQGRAIDTLGAEDIDVVEFRELFGREGFRRPEHHVTRVVDHHIETPLLGYHSCDRSVDRLLRADVELDGAEIDIIISGEFFDIGDLGRVAARGAAHRRVNCMACLGQRVGGQPTKAAGSAGDDDNLFHDTYPFLRWAVSGLRVEGSERAGSIGSVQTMPPLARSTWPLIHPPSGPTRKATSEAISAGVPSRSSGFILAKRSINSGDFPTRNRSVAVGPGATALTEMLRPRSSFDRIAVSISTAALVAA